jgi:hypothetical protein
MGVGLLEMPLTHIDDIFYDSLPQKPNVYKIFTKTHAQNGLAAWVLWGINYP